MTTTARIAPSQSRAENYRRELPQLAAGMVQVAVDNPGQLLLVGACELVLARMLVNLVRPRNIIEGVATVIVGELAAVYLLKQAVDRKLIHFRVRDAEGRLVPYEPGRE